MVHKSDMIYRRAIRVKTKVSEHGIEPDIELPSGVNLEVVDYSDDMTECCCILRTRQRDLINQVRGREMGKIRDEWRDRRAIIESEEEPGGGGEEV